MKKNEDFPSIKARNLKCFGEQEQGFEQIKPINLIVGRNNSGKSTLLDLIEYVVIGNNNIDQLRWHKGKPAQIIFEATLTENDVKQVFNERLSSGDLPGPNDWYFGRQFTNTKIKWRLESAHNRKAFDNIDECPNGKRPLDQIQNANGYLQRLVETKNNPFFGNKVYRRIFAERNIVPEPDDEKNLQVMGNGAGTTNIIQNFINNVKLPSQLIEETLLNELNTICRTDAEFIDIVCQRLENTAWEIFLEEKTKGRIPLSQSGSGLKTIILVLVYIHLIPFVFNRNLSDFIFAFEELENNLHPAMLRRLLSYLQEIAESKECLFFITTHSNITIDLFSKNRNAQIIHVTHDGEKAYCRTATTYVENRGILDDLDVRASDLLQSNGIIWVEGPSDRVYINKWINIWSEGTLIEGVHYQCIFYGGRLLSHLSSDDPDSISDGISILRVNRNAIILIDSDKQNKQSQLNSTKKRIIEEMENIDGLAWVTLGKEIENYIPADAIAKFLNVPQVKQVERYENFFDYLDNLKADEGKFYLNKKPLLAERTSQYFTKENLQLILDLSEKLEKVCNTIKKWNAL